VRLPVTPASDRARPMPDSPAACHDAISAAVRSLNEERRRVERLGLESPLARCHHETRYWKFLDALFALTPRSGWSTGPGGRSCPDAPVP
jgi:hypothetical protein